MGFLRKRSKKVDNYPGRKRLSLYPKYPQKNLSKQNSSNQLNKNSQTQNNPEENSDVLKKVTKIQRTVAIVSITLAVIILALQFAGVIDINTRDNNRNFLNNPNTNLSSSNTEENQVVNNGESTSSWTGNYIIEKISYWGGEPDCKNVITGEINFKITKKSNGEVYGTATTKNDKEDITVLGDMPPCLPDLVSPLYSDGEQAGEKVPFWFEGRINDANGLNIDYFNLHIFEFDSFTADRLDDTLTSKYVYTEEYGRYSRTLTFSVTKDIE